MNLPLAAGIVAGIGGVASLGSVYQAARRRGLDRWLVPYMLRGQRPGWRHRPVHMLVCVADHFEPKRGGASPAVARRRLDAWLDRYPELFCGFRDSDGHPPRHSFFYPIDEYEPEYLDGLASLCKGGFGEVEVHLHHDNDTAENLRETLNWYRETLAERHGLLSRDRETGEVGYGFIHGNWALDNARPDGRCCGVNNELDVLRETGCYADFTLPSYPSETQTRTINSIYYAIDDPRRPMSHDTGVRVGLGVRPANGLMMIQGPIGLDWSRPRWGILPRVENGCLQGSQPPHESRVEAWMDAGVCVPSRPDWLFVKLHTHGCVERNMEVLLGEPMLELHRALARRAGDCPNFQFHYVSAREMYNLACAAEAGWMGNVEGARDFRLVPTWQESAVAGV